MCNYKLNCNSTGHQEDIEQAKIFIIYRILKCTNTHISTKIYQKLCTYITCCGCWRKGDPFLLQQKHADKSLEFLTPIYEWNFKMINLSISPDPRVCWLCLKSRKMNTNNKNKILHWWELREEVWESLKLSPVCVLWCKLNCCLLKSHSKWAFNNLHYWKKRRA
jgi:hypothetical protein